MTLFNNYLAFLFVSLLLFLVSCDNQQTKPIDPLPTSSPKELKKIASFLNSQPDSARLLSKEYVQQALVIGDAQLERQVRLLETEAWLKLGVPDSAMESIKRIEDRFKSEIENSSAQLMYYRAYAHELYGDFDLALQLSKMATELALAENNPMLAIESELIQYDIYLTQFHYDSILLNQTEMRSQIRTYGNPGQLAQWLKIEGSRMYEIGQPKRARELLDSSAVLAQLDNNLIQWTETLFHKFQFVPQCSEIQVIESHRKVLDSIVDITGNRRHIQHILKIQAYTQLRHSETARGMELMEQICDSYKNLGLRYLHAGTQLSLAQWLINMGQRGKALELLQENFEIVKNRNYEYLELESIAHMIRLYAIMGEIDKMPDLLSELKMRTADLQPLKLKRMAVDCEKLYHLKRRDFKEAIKFQKELLAINRQLSSPCNSINTQLYLAQLYYYVGDMETSKKIFFSTLDTAKSAGYHELVALGQIHAGQMLRFRESELAIELIEEANEYFLKSHRSENIKLAYYFLADANRRTGDYKNAFSYSQKLMKFKDSINQVDINQQTALLATQLETAQKEQKLAESERNAKEKELQLEVQQSELNRSNQFLATSIISGILILISGLFLFNRYRLKKTTENLALVRKQNELERVNRETEQRLEMESLKNRFFTDVSHELRTPLTLIHGPLEQLIAERSLEKDNRLQVMLRNTNRLLDLVNQSLDLSRLESGQVQLKLEKGSFTDLPLGVVEQFQSSLNQKQVRLILSTDSDSLQGDMDSQQLRTVWNNLLSNALKHTPEKGKITVATSVVYRNEVEWLKGSVSNTGPKIDPKHLPHLFDRYYRAEDSKGTGSGIGLTLCKEIVELHGGDFTVQSDSVLGTTFTFRIPRYSDQKLPDASLKPFGIQEREAVSTDEQIPVNGTLLVVDDNPDMLIHLKGILTPQFEVVTASNGKEALEWTQKQSFDLVISDVMMPETDGIGLTQKLKENLTTSHLPVILLTAKATQEDKLTGLIIGADDYLYKPFDARELVVRAENLIRQRAQLRNLYTQGVLVPPQKVAKNKLDQDFLERARNVVDKHLQNSEFSVEYFCQEMALNRTSVHQKLKVLTGLSTSAYIRYIRVCHAAEMIRSGTTHMGTVADLVGFNSRQAFNKAFQEHFHLTPSEFSRL
ncbi:response regulator [bacterium SCSIO 12741]|nr:response regulator [bacterium SCSIO 12741]